MKRRGILGVLAAGLGLVSMAGTVMAEDEFTLYDLKVEVIATERPMVCNHQEGDYFLLSGESAEARYAAYAKDSQGIFYRSGVWTRRVSNGDSRNCGSRQRRIRSSRGPGSSSSPAVGSAAFSAPA